MRAPRRPLFLDRRVYRQRRLMDGARILPVLGAGLFMVPLIWEPQETPEPDTTTGGLFLFGAWALLILGAFLLSRRLGSDPQPRAPASEQPAEDGGR